MGFGQINSEKVDFLHLPFGACEPRKKPTKKSCIFVTVCERNLSCEKRGMLRLWFGKIPPNKQRLVEAIFFSSRLSKLEMLSYLWQPHCPIMRQKFPQGGCIMKMAWTYGTLWPKGTLNEVVEFPCHPGTLIISGHLLDASSKTKWIRLKERQTNRDRKHLEVQVPCLCAWIPKKNHHVRGQKTFFQGFIIHGATKNRRKIRKKNDKKPGDPILNKKLPPLWSE